MLGILRHILLQPARFLASASLMFLALPWLMVLLVLGTVSQRYIGLYASQKLFFGSFILWAGIVPLPGAYATLALIAFSLIAKLTLKSEFNLRRAGTLLVHVSAIVLLLGGLISALAREEGYVVLGDGQSAQSVSDYRERELQITENGVLVKSIPFAKLHAGETLALYALPFTLRVERSCFPCAAVARATPAPDARGLAEKLELVGVPYARDDAQNITGATFWVNGAGPGQDGEHIAFERLAAPDAVMAGKSRYEFTIKPVERPLPFSIRLLHFTRSDYPGTDEPRAYRSDVAVKDGGLEWNATIEMNQPLRYKGYTLYQSSFVSDGTNLASVLAVVKNVGEWFPYLSIGMLCTGLLLHILLLISARRRR